VTGRELFQLAPTGQMAARVADAKMLEALVRDRLTMDDAVTRMAVLGRARDWGSVGRCRSTAIATCSSRSRGTPRSCTIGAPPATPHLALARSERRLSRPL